MRRRPHWAQETTKTKGQSRLYNPETQATLGTINRTKTKGQSRIYNPETQATLGTRNRAKTKGQSRIYNHETQATLGTRNNKDKGTIKNIQSRDTGLIGHKKQQRQRDNQDYTIQRHRPYWAQETTKTKGQSRLHNPETQATLGTRNNKDKGTIKIIQSRDTGLIGHKKQQRQRDNQDYTIQRHRPHWAQETTKTKGQSRLYNPETQALLGTRNNKDKGTIKIIQSRDTGHIGHKKQSKDKGTIKIIQSRDTGLIVHKKQQRQRDNQDYTIQRRRPYWAQETEQRQRNKK